MSSCREVEPFLTPYADDEVESSARAAVEAHLGACPPCRERVTSERAARELVQTRKDVLRGCASDHLKRRCAGQRAAGASAPAAPVRRVPRRALIPLSVAATFLLAVAGILLFGVNQTVEALAAQLALDHVKCFQFQPTGPGSADAEALGLEWSKKRGWALKVPASSREQDLELLAVRRCASTQGLTAHLMYKWRGAPLSVYVLNSRAPGLPRVEQFVEKLGQDTIVWSRDGRTYAVVARAERAELEPIVRYVKIAAR